MAFTMPLAASNCYGNRNLSHVTIYNRCNHRVYLQDRRFQNPKLPTTAEVPFHKPSSQASYNFSSCRYMLYLMITFLLFLMYIPFTGVLICWPWRL